MRGFVSTNRRLGDFATADILSRVSGASLGRTVGPAACFGQIVARVKFLNHVAQYIFHRSMPCLRGSDDALQSLTTSPWYKGGNCSLCRIPSRQLGDSCGTSDYQRDGHLARTTNFLPLLRASVNMGLLLKKPEGTAGKSWPAIAIGMFVAFGGILFGYAISRHFPTLVV
jgi:hypothetical protein